MDFFKAYIGHPAFKKMGAKQGYSIIHGLAYLPLCFLGINALLISIIAIVSVNPIVVSFVFLFFNIIYFLNNRISCFICILLLDRFLSDWSYVLIP
jgi:AGZA family xanthine/uracil permease-like MFS transporter